MPHDDIHDEKVTGNDPDAVLVDVEPAPSGAVRTSDSVLPPVLIPDLDTGYTHSGVPTFEGVREKIENRLGTALGSTELAEETSEGRTAAHKYEQLQKAAANKVDEIRASMHKKD